MTKYVNECVGCPDGMGCLGMGCPHYRVPRVFCDHCKTEVCDDYYIIDNNDICQECIIDYLLENEIIERANA